MATIVTRIGKGTPLTNTEIDANFTNLNTELGEKLTSLTTVTVAQGGTGRETLTSGSYLKGAGTDAIVQQTGIPAGDITSGNIAVARLGTGTANSTTFLRGDGTWATVTAGATVSNDTSTATALFPTFTSITSGTMTAVSVTTTKLSFIPSTGILSATGFAGSGSGLTTLNASNLSSGTVATARLGTGTANSTTFLRGDGTWQTISGGGATVSNDTTTNSNLFPTFTSVTSGTMSTASVSNTKLQFNPSTGTLSSTIFNSLSDVSLKENIEPVKNSIDILHRLNPVSYNWKDNGNKSFGLIAQEVEDVLPEIVQETGEGLKSVAYSQIIPFLIDAIVDLQKQINSMRK